MQFFKYRAFLGHSERCYGMSPQQKMYKGAIWGGGVIPEPPNKKYDLKNIDLLL